MIWNYTVEDIVNGFLIQEEYCRCAVCGKGFEKGRVFQLEDGLYDAQGAVKRHLQAEHGSAASYLLSQDPGLLGISQIQKKLLKLLLKGKTDKEISAQLGIALSTVRNHRFKLREKQKQAKLFTALMACVEKETKQGIGKTDAGILEEVPICAAAVDERYHITDQDRAKTLAVYMDETGRLKQIPAREKKKIIVLGEIIKNFKDGGEYSEKEVDRILKRIHEEDYASIRRALIEYGFMERTPDCAVYRVKEL